HLGLIAALFPRARFIHCVRDPLDVCLSCYCHDFSRVAFACELRELGRFYLDYQRLMAHWRKLLRMPLMEVAYEELVEDPETVAGRLVAFCGLSWNDRCLGKPANKSAIGRWRHYGYHLAPLFEALERSVEDPSFSGVFGDPITFFNE